MRWRSFGRLAEMAGAASGGRPLRSAADITAFSDRVAPAMRHLLEYFSSPAATAWAVAGGAQPSDAAGSAFVSRLATRLRVDAAVAAALLRSYAADGLWTEAYTLAAADSGAPVVRGAPSASAPATPASSAAPATTERRLTGRALAFDSDMLEDVARFLDGERVSLLQLAATALMRAPVSQACARAVEAAFSADGADEAFFGLLLRQMRGLASNDGPPHAAAAASWAAQTIAEACALLEVLVAAMHAGRRPPRTASFVTQVLEVLGLFTDRGRPNSLALLSAAASRSESDNRGASVPVSAWTALAAIAACDLGGAMDGADGGGWRAALVEVLEPLPSSLAADLPFRALLQLLWAALASLDSSGIRRSPTEVAQRGAAAAQQGALGLLRELAQHIESEMDFSRRAVHGSVLQGCLQLLTRAFRLDSPAAFDSLVVVFHAVYSGNEQLAGAFLRAYPALENAPLIDLALRRFPVEFLPLVRLFDALASGATAALKVFRALSSLPFVSCLSDDVPWTLLQSHGAHRYEFVRPWQVHGVAIPVGALCVVEAADTTAGLIDLVRVRVPGGYSAWSFISSAVLGEFLAHADAGGGAAARPWAEPVLASLGLLARVLEEEPAVYAALNMHLREQATAAGQETMLLLPAVLRVLEFCSSVDVALRWEIAAACLRVVIATFEADALDVVRCVYRFGLLQALAPAGTLQPSLADAVSSGTSGLREYLLQSALKADALGHSCAVRTVALLRRVCLFAHRLRFARSAAGTESWQPLVLAAARQASEFLCADAFLLLQNWPTRSGMDYCILAAEVFSALLLVLESPALRSGGEAATSDTVYRALLQDPVPVDILTCALSVHVAGLDDFRLKRRANDLRVAERLLVEAMSVVRSCLTWRAVTMPEPSALELAILLRGVAAPSASQGGLRGSACGGYESCVRVLAQYVHYADFSAGGIPSVLALQLLALLCAVQVDAGSRVTSMISLLGPAEAAALRLALLRRIRAKKPKSGAARMAATEFFAAALQHQPSLALLLLHQQPSVDEQVFLAEAPMPCGFDVLVSLVSNMCKEPALGAHTAQQDPAELMLPLAAAALGVLRAAWSAAPDHRQMLQRLRESPRTELWTVLRDALRWMRSSSAALALASAESASPAASRNARAVEAYLHVSCSYILDIASFEVFYVPVQPRGVLDAGLLELLKDVLGRGFEADWLGQLFDPARDAAAEISLRAVASISRSFVDNYAFAGGLPDGAPLVPVVQDGQPRVYGESYYFDVNLMARRIDRSRLAPAAPCVATACDSLESGPYIGPRGQQATVALTNASLPWTVEALNRASELEATVLLANTSLSLLDARLTAALSLRQLAETVASRQPSVLGAVPSADDLLGTSAVALERLLALRFDTAPASSVVWAHELSHIAVRRAIAAVSAGVTSKSAALSRLTELAIAFFRAARAGHLVQVWRNVFALLASVLPLLPPSALDCRDAEGASALSEEDLDALGSALAYALDVRDLRAHALHVVGCLARAGDRLVSVARRHYLARRVARLLGGNLSTLAPVDADVRSFSLSGDATAFARGDICLLTFGPSGAGLLRRRDWVKVWAPGCEPMRPAAEERPASGSLSASMAERGAEMEACAVALLTLASTGASCAELVASALLTPVLLDARFELYVDPRTTLAPYVTVVGDVAKLPGLAVSAAFGGDVSSIETGEVRVRNPFHVAWCALLRVVAACAASLSGNDRFLEQMVEFLSRHRARLVHAVGVMASAAGSNGAVFPPPALTVAAVDEAAAASALLLVAGRSTPLWGFHVPELVLFVDSTFVRLLAACTQMLGAGGGVARVEAISVDERALAAAGDAGVRRLALPLLRLAAAHLGGRCRDGLSQPLFAVSHSVDPPGARSRGSSGLQTGAPTLGILLQGARICADAMRLNLSTDPLCAPLAFLPATGESAMLQIVELLLAIVARHLELYQPPSVSKQPRFEESATLGSMARSDDRLRWDLVQLDDLQRQVDLLRHHHQ
jgi:hypothetical protein